MLGGALGDAWGGGFEGTLGATFHIPSRPALSDDTQLTLATCESVLQAGRIEPQTVASQFLRRFKLGQITGMGSSTLKAMRDLAMGTHWALAGARGEYAAGNGAAMRIAPLAFLLDPADPTDRVTIRDVCRITHHNDEAYVGALAVVFAIRAVLAQAWSKERTFLRCVAHALPDSAVRDRINELMPLHVPAIEVARKFGSTGHVVDTVPLALYSAQSIAADTIPAVLRQTIRLGGDTDTIASITGQLAGTVVGSQGIPFDHVRDIRGSEELLETTQAFANLIQRTQQVP